jgi:hypothetical protein
MNMHWKRTTIVAVAVVLGASAVYAQATGPTSSESPYIVPTAPDWSATSLLTVGDEPAGSTYRMVGIPDGLGALAGRFDKTTGELLADPAFITVFMNHELGATSGAVRAHGRSGAFVSEWTVELNSLSVIAGRDLVNAVYTWQNGTHALASGATAGFDRLCSADLPALTAFYNQRSGRGFNGRIYMNGEEAGTEGRAFGHVVTGPERRRAYELPHLGRFNWENSIAHPKAGNKTLVVGLDDSTPGQVYVYVGDKQAAGSPVQRAGLVGGKLYGIKVTNGGINYGSGAVPLENNGAIDDGMFTLADVTASASTLQSGADLQNRSVNANVTEFARPEDGQWDTKDPRAFYFVTTGATVGGNVQSARLYKLRFNDLRKPTGGTIELVVDSASLVGTDGQVARKFDNITVNRDGKVLIQEDPSGETYIAKIWQVDPINPLAAVQIFEADRNRFAPFAPGFLTIDEESSGIIEVTQLVKAASWFKRGRRYYLGVMQAHYPHPDPELVEGGQFFIMQSSKVQ